MNETPIKQKTCGHEASSMDQKNLNGLGDFCLECNMSCCKSCFINHVGHKWHRSQYTDEEFTNLVKKLNEDRIMIF